MSSGKLHSIYKALQASRSRVLAMIDDEVAPINTI